jgi:hypothetical protein
MYWKSHIRTFPLRRGFDRFIFAAWNEEAIAIVAVAAG